MANEKRLIYLEDAIALLEKDVVDSKDALKTAYYGEKDVIWAEMNGVRAAIHILKHHASHGGTVDAVEVVHGRWLNWKGEPFPADDFGWDWTCSECKNTLTFEEPVTAEEFASNYCPHCGAKMDGDGNG